MERMKTCGRCREEKSLAEFHRRGPRGHQACCKTCRSDIDRQRREPCACGQPKSQTSRRCRACHDADVPPPRLEISAAEVAWVAGILEGEGCWTQRRATKPRWWVAVRMTDKDIIERLAEVTGIGRVTPAPSRRGHKMAWAWQV